MASDDLQHRCLAKRTWKRLLATSPFNHLWNEMLNVLLREQNLKLDEDCESNFKYVHMSCQRVYLNYLNQKERLLVGFTEAMQFIPVVPNDDHTESASTRHSVTACTSVDPTTCLGKRSRRDEPQLGIILRLQLGLLPFR